MSATSRTSTPLPICLEAASVEEAERLPCPGFYPNTAYNPAHRCRSRQPTNARKLPCYPYHRGELVVL